MKDQKTLPMDIVENGAVINQYEHFGKFTQDYRKGNINSAMDINTEEEGAPICSLNCRQKCNSFQ